MGDIGDINKMYCLENFCFLCLKPDIITTSYDKNIEEKLKYLIPKYHILQVSKISKNFCDNCLETLNSFHEFHRKCVKSIEISNDYVQKLSHKNDSYTCLSVKLTDILLNGDSGTVMLIQANDESIKRELKEQILETNNYVYNENVEVPQKNDEEIISKIENTTNSLVVKKEITSELILEDENSEPTEDKSTHIEGSPYSCDTGEKPYECDVCKKRFSQKNCLKYHESVHSCEKPYSCDVCTKSFSHKIRLTEHRRIHTGEKPYECDVCKKRFYRKSKLSDHQRVHTGERPYTCDVCKKNFSRKSHLQDHRRVHSGEKPYECDICNKKFTCKSNLNRHKKCHNG